MLYDYAVKNKFNWGRRVVNNNVKMKWYYDIIVDNGKETSCPDWAAAICYDALTYDYKCTIFKCGFSAKNFDKYHIIPVVMKKGEIIVYNYLGSKYSDKVIYRKPIVNINLINSCLEYSKRFLPIMYDNILTNKDKDKDLIAKCIVANPYSIMKLLAEVTGGNITQKDFLDKAFKNIICDKQIKF